MLTVDDIPTYWRLALGRVQRVDPNAVISGGAIRDLDMGRPIKDVDIFVSHGTVMLRVYEALGILADEWLESPEYAINMSMIDCSATAQEENNLPINVTRLSKRAQPDDRWAKHDFGICQIMFDGTKIVATSQYEEDKVEQKMTLMYCDTLDKYRRSLKRYLRLFKKYPWPMEFKHCNNQHV